MVLSQTHIHENPLTCKIGPDRKGYLQFYHGSLSKTETSATLSIIKVAHSSLKYLSRLTSVFTSNIVRGSLINTIPILNVIRDSLNRPSSHKGLLLLRPLECDSGYH